MVGNEDHIECSIQSHPFRLWLPRRHNIYSITLHHPFLPYPYWRGWCGARHGL